MTKKSADELKSSSRKVEEQLGVDVENGQRFVAKFYQKFERRVHHMTLPGSLEPGISKKIVPDRRQPPKRDPY